MEKKRKKKKKKRQLCQKFFRFCTRFDIWIYSASNWSDFIFLQQFELIDFVHILLKTWNEYSKK